MSSEGQDTHERAIARAMLDYGHYAQMLFQRDRDWKLGVDHGAVTEQTSYTAQTCQEARALIEDAYGVISCERAKGVSAVKVSLNMGSMVEPRVQVETAEEIGAVSLDGELLDEGSWTVLHR